MNSPSDESLLEVWQMVDDCGELLPLYLVGKFSLSELMKRSHEFQCCIVTDSNGNVLSKNRYTNA